MPDRHVGRFAVKASAKLAIKPEPVENLGYVLALGYELIAYTVWETLRFESRVRRWVRDDTDPSVLTQVLNGAVIAFWIALSVTSAVAALYQDFGPLKWVVGIYLTIGAIVALVGPILKGMLLPDDVMRFRD